MNKDAVLIKRGIYFLSDERILELTVAFLNSLRKYNPDIPLCLIPYDENIPRLRGLQQFYGFSIFSNTPIFELCREISVSYHGRVCGEYRKLAMWEGEFDEFIFIDADTVVLTNLDFVFDLLADYDFVTSHSNLPETFKWVWKDSVFQSGLLNKDQILYAASTGFIASKKGMLGMEVVKGMLENAYLLAPHMNLNCQEQSFLNYLMVASDKRYTSLEVLLNTGLYQGIKAERWAGEPHGVVKNGQIHFKHKPTPVLVLHWAGEWHPVLRDKIRFYILRIIGIIKNSDRPFVSKFLPYRKLWRYYRYLDKNVTKYLRSKKK